MNSAFTRSVLDRYASGLRFGQLHLDMGRKLPIKTADDAPEVFSVERLPVIRNGSHVGMNGIH